MPPRIVVYTPDWFDRLASAVASHGSPPSLLHRSFVDHYYAASDYARLYLWVDADDKVAATVGVEVMPPPPMGLVLAPAEPPLLVAGKGPAVPPEQAATSATDDASPSQRIPIVFGSAWVISDSEWSLTVAPSTV